MRLRAIAGVIALVFVLATACATGSSTLSPAPSSAHSPSVLSPSPAAATWLVILRVAPSPAGVRTDAAALAPVLGGAIQVAPGSCFTGLPARFGGDRYILGAVGGSLSEVDAYATSAQIEPLFEGEVQVVCVD